MIIKILGSGCPSCRKLEANARESISRLGIDAEVEKVTDFETIARYGVLALPALVVDEQLKVAGRIPGVQEVENVLKNDQGT